MVSRSGLFAGVAATIVLCSAPAHAATTLADTSSPAGWTWTGPLTPGAGSAVAATLPPSAGNPDLSLFGGGAISARSNSVVPEPGNYIFTKSFDVTNGSSLRFLTLAWLADNLVNQIVLNGIVLPLSNVQNLGNSAPLGNQFGPNVGPFTATWNLSDSGATFNDGTNNLAVRLMQRDLGPAGPRGDENNHAWLAMRVSGAVPEPGTWMLMILGFGAVGFAMRRRQKTAVRFQFA